MANLIPWKIKRNWVKWGEERENDIKLIKVPARSSRNVLEVFCGFWTGDELEIGLKMLKLWLKGTVSCRGSRKWWMKNLLFLKILENIFKAY